MTTRPRDPRRFLRFGLRTLLLLVALAAVLTWLYRQYVIPHREEQEFLAAAAKAGAAVTIQPWRSSTSELWTSSLDFGFLDRVVAVSFSGPNEWNLFQDGQWVENIGAPNEPTTDSLFPQRGVNRVPGIRPLPWEMSALPGHDADDLRQCLERLRRLAGLRRLSLAGVGFGDGDWRYLHGLQQLEHLELRSSRVSDAGLANLATLPRLKHLGLSYTDVSDAGLKELAALSGLETLDLSGTKVTDAGIRSLALPNLKRLYLANCQQVEAVELVGFPALEHLDLSNSSARTLAAKKAPHLRSLNLRRTFTSNQSLETIAELTSLRRLGIATTPAGGEDGLSQLRKLPGLEELCIDIPSIGDEGLEHLKAFPSLKTLHLVWANLPGQKERDQKIRDAMPASVTVHSPPPAAGGGFF
jgi:internalin A